MCRPYTFWPTQERFSNLKWCRSHHKVCSVLETIKAFGWICWGILTILLVITLIKLVLSDTGSRSNRGTRATPAAAATAAAYPDTRQTTTSTTVHDRTQPTQGVTAPHGAKQNTHTGINAHQQSHQSPPTTTPAQGALYQQGIDQPHTGSLNV